ERGAQDLVPRDDASERVGERRLVERALELDDSLDASRRAVRLLQPQLLLLWRDAESSYALLLHAPAPLSIRLGQSVCLGGRVGACFFTDAAPPRAARASVPRVSRLPLPYSPCLCSL